MPEKFSGIFVFAQRLFSSFLPVCCSSRPGRSGISSPGVNKSGSLSKSTAVDEHPAKSAEMSIAAVKLSSLEMNIFTSLSVLSAVG